MREREGRGGEREGRGRGGDGGEREGREKGEGGERERRGRGEGGKREGRGRGKGEERGGEREGRGKGEGGEKEGREGHREDVNCFIKCFISIHTYLHLCYLYPLQRPFITLPTSVLSPLLRAVGVARGVPGLVCPDIIHG